ncbi:MAG: hypothetical protein ABI611_09160 [Solirubrobacteraceae bacterium]
MKTKTGRFERTHRFVQTRRGARAELLALRYELELLDEALRAAPAPASARVALDLAFTRLRAGERTWLEAHGPADLPLIVTQIDASRDALEASVAARAGTQGANA